MGPNDALALPSVLPPSLGVQNRAADRAGALAKELVPTRNYKDIDEAAREFEGLFIGQMLAPMFEGIEVDPVFGGGIGEEQYRGLIIQQYGREIAAHGGFGIADAVRAELLKAQQAAQGATPVSLKPLSPAREGGASKATEKPSTNNTANLAADAAPAALHPSLHKFIAIQKEGAGHDRH